MYKKKCILAISSIPSGMRKFFFEGNMQIEGMPAYAMSILGLLERGYEIHLICLADQPTKAPKFDNLHIYNILSQPFSDNFFNKLKRSISYLKILYLGIKLNRMFKFDLIYGYGDIGFLAGILSIITKKNNIRRIYGTFLFSKLKKNTIIQKMKILIKDTARYMVFSLPTDALIITNDGTHGDKVASILGQPPSKIYYLYNGVDLELGKKINIEYANQVFSLLGKESHQPVIVYISRLTEWKRVDRAINAIYHVKYKPTPLLIIIGDGPCRTSLEQLAHKLGLEKNVRFLGQIAHEKAISILALSDISLSLYDFANLGNVIIESMILGKCIISLNDGSLDGVIEDGFNGVLLNNPDPRLIANAIDHLLENRCKLEHYGVKAKDRALKIFSSWHDRINKEIEIIDYIIENNYEPKHTKN